MKLIYAFILFFTFSLSAFAQSPSQKLLLVGGGNRPQAALTKWAELTSQFNIENPTRSKKILVITWASGVPNEVYEDLKNDLAVAGLESEASLRGPITEVEKRLLLKQISNSSGIFFSGGDQKKIMKVLQDADIMAAIKSSYWQIGMPFAGTSAGTAIMSEKMILGPDLGIADGLGFLPKSVVDQHFLYRNRVDRLKKALREAPAGFIGVGVDEDGSILFQNVENRNEFKGIVLGDKQVMIISPTNSGEQPTHLLNPNDITEWKTSPMTNCDLNF
ncbi:MAG: cyanophycinase [Bacteriovoracaceae bacterium]